MAEQMHGFFKNGRNRGFRHALKKPASCPESVGALWKPGTGDRDAGMRASLCSATRGKVYGGGEPCGVVQREGQMPKPVAPLLGQESPRSVVLGRVKN